MDDPDGMAQIERASAALWAAYQDLEAAVDGVADPVLAEKVARDDVADLLARCQSARAVLRARQVARIAESREMDLTELGRLIGGLSKQRIGAILRTARYPRFANQTEE